MMNTKLLRKSRVFFYVILLACLTACSDSAQTGSNEQSEKAHVYIQTFSDNDKTNIKIYSLLEFTPLDIDYQAYEAQNPWLKDYWRQTFNGEADQNELDQRSVDSNKAYIENTKFVRVIGDYRFGDRGALLLTGTPTRHRDSGRCTYILYKQQNDNSRILDRQHTPTTLMVYALYGQCFQSKEIPMLETVSAEDRAYYFEKKCDGLCKEIEGIIYQNKLPQEESLQFQQALMEHVREQVPDLRERELEMLQPPRIAVFGDRLFLLDRIERYERNQVFYNLQFKKNNGLWEYENHNEPVRTLEFIRSAERAYDYQ